MHHDVPFYFVGFLKHGVVQYIESGPYVVLQYAKDEANAKNASLASQAGIFVSCVAVMSLKVVGTESPDVEVAKDGGY
jgi:hypothetical protein